MAARYTEEAFSVILGNNDTLGGMPDAYAPQSHDHFESLVKYWNDDLRHRVSPFAFETSEK